jgi:N-acetylglutamate synthase-like GNAT family acetyltransferase
MIIRKMLPSELPWALQCYSEGSFVHSGDDDFIAVAEDNGFKAGIGRILSIRGGLGELGGVIVLPEFKDKGLEEKIIEFLLAQCGNRSLFCLPFVQLEDFYRRYGFTPIDLTMDIPLVIAEKFRWCQEYYEIPVVLMHREAGPTP